jgi:hypothetical protein
MQKGPNNGPNPDSWAFAGHYKEVVIFFVITQFAKYFTIMKKKITVYTNHNDLHDHDRKFFLSLSPDERLNHVELLRLEAGKFLYEYPARLRRTVKVTRRTSR